MSFIKTGSINFKDLNSSSFCEDIFKIPAEKQHELVEKGETEFMIITKTSVTLKIVKE